MLRECGASRAQTKPVANFEKEYMMATAKKKTAAKKPAAKKTAAKKPAAKKKTAKKK
jgi:DNA topoisomerase-1